MVNYEGRRKFPEDAIVSDGQFESDDLDNASENLPAPRTSFGTTLTIPASAPATKVHMGLLKRHFCYGVWLCRVD
jgi:hypothetical protein